MVVTPWCGLRVVPAMERARQQLPARIVVRTTRQERTGVVGLMPLQRRRSSPGTHQPSCLKRHHNISLKS